MQTVPDLAYLVVEWNQPWKQNGLIKNAAQGIRCFNTHIFWEISIPKKKNGKQVNYKDCFISTEKKGIFVVTRCGLFPLPLLYLQRTYSHILHTQPTRQSDQQSNLLLAAVALPQAGWTGWPSQPLLNSISVFLNHLAALSHWDKNREQNIQTVEILAIFH